jgi:hypothetical protein
VPKTINRCSACRAIELDGELVPLTGYDTRKLREQGYITSDTFLSQECYGRHYAEEIESGYISKRLDGVEHENCPEITNPEAHTEAVMKTIFDGNGIESMLKVDKTVGNKVKVLVKLEEGFSPKDKIVKRSIVTSAKQLKNVGFRLNISYLKKGNK